MLIYLSTRFPAASKMRVGGIDLDVQFCHRLCIGLSLATIAIWFCLSFSTAVLLLTAFCFGAGILSISLDLSTGHQLPNFLSNLQRPFIQGDKSSKRQNVKSGNHEENVLVPLEIDQAWKIDEQRKVHHGSKKNENHEFCLFFLSETV